MKKKKLPPLGSGERFKTLSQAIAGNSPGVKDPDAVAASIGRKKFGAKKFQAMASAGKKK